MDSRSNKISIAKILFEYTETKKKMKVNIDQLNNEKCY